MPGEMDLDTMLATLTVTRRPEVYVYVHLDHGAGLQLGDGVVALVDEDEGLTVVATKEHADEHGWTYDFEAAWLTLDVHSALEAVGLTAAFSAALGAEAIPCNVLAGYHHDHLLVPLDRADDATASLLSLRKR